MAGVLARLAGEASRSGSFMEGDNDGSRDPVLAVEQPEELAEKVDQKIFQGGASRGNLPGLDGAGGGGVERDGDEGTAGFGQHAGQVGGAGAEAGVGSVSEEFKARLHGYRFTLTTSSQMASGTVTPIMRKRSSAFGL